MDPSLPPNTLSALREQFEQFPDIVSFSLKGSVAPAYLISAPELVEQVFAKQHRRIERGFSADRVALVLGDGLLVSDGDLWKAQRQVMHPMFHGDALERPARLVSRCLAKAVAGWRAYADSGRWVDLNQEMLDFSLDINLQSLFGSDTASLLDRVASDLFARLTEEPAGSVRENLEFLRDVKAVRRWITERIRERRSKAQASNDDVLDDLCLARRKTDDGQLEEELIVDELVNLLTAGHVTLASALSHACVLLANEPSQLRQMRKEIAQVCGTQAPAQEHLPSLHQARQAAMECLRLCPPIWILTRRVLSEFELAGEQVPCGAHLVISPYLVHRHPSVWHTPDRFDASRFAADQSKSRSRYAFMPFSAGPRSCLGDQLSVMELTLSIATIFGEFQLDVSSEERCYQPGFVYRGADPLLVRFSRL